jgi:UDP-glucose 6-dehydrogenase
MKILSGTKGHYISMLLCSMLLISCDPKNRGEWIIQDVSKDTVLTAITNIKNCNVLILKITGQTDDSIMVRSIPIAGGIINKDLSVDHYDPKISLYFKAHKAKKGNVKISYYLPGSSLY